MLVDHLSASLSADQYEAFSAAKEAGLPMTPGTFRKRTRVPGKHASDARVEKGDEAWLAATTACLTFAAAVVTLIAALLALFMH
jgi:hypothetical protein